MCCAALTGIIDLTTFAVYELSLDTSNLWPNMTYGYVWSFNLYANTTEVAPSQWFLDNGVNKFQTLHFRFFGLGYGLHMLRCIILFAHMHTVAVIHPCFHKPLFGTAYSLPQTSLFNNVRRSPSWFRIGRYLAQWTRS